MYNKEVCNRCKFPKNKFQNAGSLTSYLLLDLRCQCDAPKSETPIKKVSPASISCAKCGKVIRDRGRIGSFTNLMLANLRCNCKTPQPTSAAVDLGTKHSVINKEQRRSKYTQTSLKQTKGLNIDAVSAALFNVASGEIIGGYRLNQLAGEGGMGVVYQAEQIALARQVALKILTPSLVSEKSWALFKEEAKLCSTLNHPGICRIYDLGLHKGALPFYAMDFIDGRTLEDLISAKGTLSVGSALEIFTKVAEVLGYAHRRSIIHKDIKPANIMLEPISNGYQIKILDFGISELSSDSTESGKEVFGSAPYMSPEQIRGDKLDARSDIYSFGCTLFETITGEPPFDGDSYDAIANKHLITPAPKLSKIIDTQGIQTLEAVLEKCLEKNPDSRYANIGQAMIDLQRIQASKPLQFAEIKTVRKISKDSDHRDLRLPAALAILSFGTVAGVAGILMFKDNLQQFVVSTRNISGFNPEANLRYSKPLLEAHQDSYEVAMVGRPEFGAYTTSNTTDNKTFVFNTSYKLKLARMLGISLNDFSWANIADYRASIYAAPIDSYSEVYNCEGTLSSDGLRKIYVYFTQEVLGVENFVNGFGPGFVDIVGLPESDFDQTKLIKACLKSFREADGLCLYYSHQDPRYLDLLRQFKCRVLHLYGWEFKDTYRPLEGMNFDTLSLENCEDDLEDFFDTGLKQRLKNLIIQQDKFENGWAESICSLPNLDLLAIKDARFDKAARLKYILENTSARVLYLRISKYPLSELASQKISLSKSLKKIQIRMKFDSIDSAGKDFLHQLANRFKDCDISLNVNGDKFAPP